VLLMSYCSSLAGWQCRDDCELTVNLSVSFGEISGKTSGETCGETCGNTTLKGVCSKHNYEVV
jgi:hypothetical protein